MSGELLWNKIISEVNQKIYEIQTSTGLWFSIYQTDGDLCIDKANNNEPSCNIAVSRKISKKEFVLVEKYYDKWVKGDIGVRQEVSRKSRNTAYIFAMIHRFGR